MGPSANVGSQSIDALLAQLRVAGDHPPAELLDAVRALGMEAVPALIALVSSPVEYEIAESDTENLTGWAPYSAIEILGELHPPEALHPLLSLLPWEDYDYLSYPLTRALGTFGEPALDPLTAVLSNRHRSVWTRWRAAEALGKLGASYPGLRDEVIIRLVTQLDREEPGFDDLDTLRGGLVAELVELHATEAIPSIIRAYDEGPIDDLIVSWHEVRQELQIPPDVASHLDERERRPLLGYLVPPTPAEEAEWEAAKALTLSHAAHVPYHRDTPKVGRNDPCPCGSGKKYKRCHGR